MQQLNFVKASAGVIIMYNVWNKTPLVFKYFDKVDSKVGEKQSFTEKTFAQQ